MATPFKTNIKAIRLSIAILVGLVLGALFGLVMPPWAEPATSLISTVYLHGLTMMIYPLVFCSLIVGIKGIGSVSATGKVGGQALLYFIGTTLFASLLACSCPRRSTSAPVWRWRWRRRRCRPRSSPASWIPSRT